MSSLISSRRLLVKRLTNSKKFLEAENFLQPIGIKSILRDDNAKNREIIKAFKEKQIITENEYQNDITNGEQGEAFKESKVITSIKLACFVLPTEWFGHGHGSSLRSEPDPHQNW